MVQELYHVLLERDSTCHRTCFKIYYEDKPLDHFIEIRNIPNIKSRSVFFVIEGKILFFLLFLKLKFLQFSVCSQKVCLI